MISVVLGRATLLRGFAFSLFGFNLMSRVVDFDHRNMSHGLSEKGCQLGLAL